MPLENARKISQLVQMACALEVCAPKPGNVNRRHDFPDASLEDFILSAIAVGPAFENAFSSGVGQIVFDAVLHTKAWARSNTNLGMILLFAPLAKACAGASGIGEVRTNLLQILDALTVEDARLAYAAIRSARPGGLGTAPQSDVSEDPGITLLQAMSLAKERDAIAREYATGYAITFGIGLPAITHALRSGTDMSSAIVQTFLTLLREVPDTLIARKKGMEAARTISRQAAAVLARGGILSPEGRTALAEMDRALRDEAHTLNPGTTADLTAAAVFLALYIRESGKDAHGIL